MLRVLAHSIIVTLFAVDGADCAVGATAHTGEGWGSIATDSGYNRHYNFAFSLLFNTIGNGGPLQRGADSPTGLNCAELGRPFTWNDAMHITCLVYSVLLKSHGHPDGLHCGPGARFKLSDFVCKSQSCMDQVRIR